MSYYGTTDYNLEDDIETASEEAMQRYENSLEIIEPLKALHAAFGKCHELTSVPLIEAINMVLDTINDQIGLDDEAVYAAWPELKAENDRWQAAFNARMAKNRAAAAVQA